MEIALLTIAALLAVVITVCLVMVFISQKGKSGTGNKEDPPANRPPSVVVSGGLVTVRSAGSTVEVMMQGPEPVLGALSDMSLDLRAWDSLWRKDIPVSQKQVYVEKLREQGFRRTYESVATNAPSSEDKGDVGEIDEEFFSNLVYEPSDDGPAGELVYEALSDDDVCDMMDMIRDYVKSGRTTPAFVRKVSEVYSFSLKFSDPQQEAQSHDKELLAEADKYMDFMKGNIQEAFERYNRDMTSSGRLKREDSKKDNIAEHDGGQKPKSKKIVVDGLLDFTSLRKHRK